MLGLPLPPGGGAVGSAGAGGSAGGAAGGSGGGGLDMPQVCKDLRKLLVCLLYRTHETRLGPTCHGPLTSYASLCAARVQACAVVCTRLAAGVLCPARCCVLSHHGCACRASSRRQTSTMPLLIAMRTVEEARLRAEVVAAVGAAAVRVSGGRPQRAAVRVAGRMAPPRSVRKRPRIRIAKCSTWWMVGQVQKRAAGKERGRVGAGAVGTPAVAKVLLGLGEARLLLLGWRGRGGGYYDRLRSA